jgi:hypothetical protein
LFELDDDDDDEDEVVVVVGVVAVVVTGCVAVLFGVVGVDGVSRDDGCRCNGLFNAPAADDGVVDDDAAAAPLTCCGGVDGELSMRNWFMVAGEVEES